MQTLWIITIFTAGWVTGSAYEESHRGDALQVPGEYPSKQSEIFGPSFKFSCCRTVEKDLRWKNASDFIQESTLVKHLSFIFDFHPDLLFQERSRTHVPTVENLLHAAGNLLFIKECTAGENIAASLLDWVISHLRGNNDYDK